MDPADALNRYSDALFMLRLRRFGFAGDSFDDAMEWVMGDSRNRD